MTAKDQKRQITEVAVLVANPPDHGISTQTRFKEGPAETKKWPDWPAAAYNACIDATKAGMDSFDVAFTLEGGEIHWMTLDVPADPFGAGKFGGSLMSQVEHRLEQRGFDCNYNSNGLWVIHRPDPSNGYSTRGYFDALTTIRLATGDASTVDEAIKRFQASRNGGSSMTRYLQMQGTKGGSAMGKKDAAEEAAKKQVTTKALDGTEVPVSPKQQEILEAIKKRSASGSPVGSDDERLDDPSSIAAMKLATGEHPVVVRAKFGSRWHYFAKQADADKATSAAEKAAADTKKASSKKASKESADSGSTEAGKKKKGPLKKPSEK